VWIFYSAIPLGSYLMCFRFLQVTWSFIRTGELPHHDHGHVDGLEEETPVDATEALEEYEEHKFDSPGRTGGKR
jgi:C4-dicarboxylate transporter DctQ subunit